MSKRLKYDETTLPVQYRQPLPIETVEELAGITYRQLTWWEGLGCLRRIEAKEKHARFEAVYYSAFNCLVACVMGELRRRGMSLQELRATIMEIVVALAKIDSGLHTSSPRSMSDIFLVWSASQSELMLGHSVVARVSDLDFGSAVVINVSRHWRRILLHLKEAA